MEAAYDVSEKLPFAEIIVIVSINWPNFADQIWKMLMKTANQIEPNLFTLVDFKVIQERYAEYF